MEAAGKSMGEEFPKRAQPLVNQSDLFGKPIRGHQAFAGVVGTFYNMLGARVTTGELLVTDNTLSLCPDLMLRDDRTVIEVKAASTQTMYRLSIEQFQKYMQLHLQGDFRVMYALFEHGLRGGFKHLAEKTLRAAMKQLALNTRFLAILDLSIIRRCIEIANRNNGDRSIALVEDGIFYTDHLQLSHTHVRNFVHAPVSALESLGLPLSDYLLTQSAVTNASISDFEIASFPVVYVLKKDRVPIKRKGITAEELELLVGPQELISDSEDTPF